MPKKAKILFLCTGNSCRSQMAEGWARSLKEDSVEPYSAGIEKHGLNPHAVRVMREAGVDISGQTSNTVSEIGSVNFDTVVTVCGNADENCPTFAGAPGSYTWDSTTLLGWRNLPRMKRRPWRPIDGLETKSGRS